MPTAWRCPIHLESTKARRPVHAAAPSVGRGRGIGKAFAAIAPSSSISRVRVMPPNLARAAQCHSNARFL